MPRKHDVNNVRLLHAKDIQNHHGCGVTTDSLDSQLILSMAGIQQAAAALQVAKVLENLVFCQPVHLQTYWQNAVVM
ncbi:TPA: hypothetical protein SMF79_002354 [Serratia marcescens]|uniref:hypothetical protein n=1 Tax=Serratia marcescens TaxID=615 RepID=UPI0029DF5524|nr:hypothetical protein [Serratia marcescens]HEJ8125407.1 hypothetical protein [Serratia marcescens]